MIDILNSNTIYVKIYENRIYIRNLDDRREIELSSESPFTTERLLIGDFTVAQTLLTKGIKMTMGRTFFAPTILMYPKEKVDGGLSQVEERVLRDLAISAGAQKIIVWVGHDLTDNDVLPLFCCEHYIN